ncbi:MAG: indole-3-glycerol phosphate synthase TrpC [Muribaculaceae bacterium]|nr:indole-3-glycerol phosphate synthase TrpC [Muribaculaceae bacterium]
MMNILEKIAATKRIEVEALKATMPLEAAKMKAHSVIRSVLSMRESIRSHNPGIIAEHKRRSPSKGEISPMSEVAEIAKAYAEAGAAAMSVLTDTPYFGGSLTDLAVARAAAPRLPLLRKEFIIDDFQIYQARIFGADAILLIAAMLDKTSLHHLKDTAHSLGLEVLVEVHSTEEIGKVPEDADMVGVNNRDLTSFSTDISNSARLIEALPDEMVKVAESGIRTPEDIRRLSEAGFDGFLIGEAFMSTPDPGATLRRFIQESRL